MADINYLYYGDLQVDLLALMNKMANEVTQYVYSLPWTKKRKDMFMSAYSDIMNKGLKGASNNTGLWMIDFGGKTIDWNSKSRKEKEMYEEAGYFIQLQMNSLANSSLKTEEEKEEEKVELPKFTNTDFINLFNTLVLNDWFGGRDASTSEWNEYDARGENGIRGISERAHMLAASLEKYKNSLTDNLYDFTNSPFSDINDFRTKLQTAINDLRSENPDLNSIKKSLNSIGIDSSIWFNNGSGDTYVDENGYSYTNQVTNKPFTYGEWYNYLNQLKTQKEEEETKAAEEKQKALDNIKIYTSRGRKNVFTLEDLSNKYSGDLNKAIETYKGKSLQSLTQEENDELVSLFLQGYDNSNALDLLTDLDWELIKSKFPEMLDSDRNNFRKIEGLDNLFYNINNKNLILFNNGSLISNNPESKNFLKGLSKEEKKDAEQLRLIFEGSGLTAEDVADISATFIDLAGIGATFIPVVGNVAGAATGAAGSLTHFGADWSRDGLDWGDVRRLGVNLAFDAATLIPGFGTAAKAGKIAKFLLPKVPYIIAGIGAIQGLSNGTNIINSFKKLSNPNTVTVEDLQNMAQGIALLAGGVNVSRGIYQTKKNSKVSTPSELAEITTRNGRTIKLNEEEFNTLNSKTATREAKQKAIESAALREGKPLDTTDGIEYSSRSLRHPLRSSKTSVEVEGLKTPKASTQGVDIAKIRLEDKRWLAQNPWAARILPGRTLDSKLNWTNRGMFIRGYETPKQESTIETSKPSVENSKVSLEVTTLKNNFEYFPKDINAKDIGELSNALNAPEYKLRRETKIPQVNLNIKAKLADGTNLEISFNGKDINISGSKELELELKSLNSKLKGKDLHLLKLELGKWINKINSEKKVNLKKDSKEWKEFVNSIKNLKRKGYLFKLGGRITDNQIDNFLKQYKV